MVSIRRRKRQKRDVFVVDYRDGAGVRRLVTCATKEEAENVAATKTLQSRQAAGAAVVSVHVTVKEYAAVWLEQLSLTVKPSTRRTYTSLLNTHVVPELGWVRLRRLTTERIRTFLAAKLDSKALAPGTVGLLRATLTAMLSAAVEDHLIYANPAAGLRRRLRRLRQTSSRETEPKALTVEELDKLLETARTRYPEFHPLVLLLARSGLRLGEALGLEWREVDLQGRELRVVQTLSRGASENLEARLDVPKSNRERRVDLSTTVCNVLGDAKRQAQAEALAAGSNRLPRFVFHDASGAPLDAEDVRTVFARMLQTAKLPGHFTPHSLRHSYAVHLLQRNTPITYVKEQLGHSSISVTVDTYGRWLPSADKRFVDALDGKQEAVKGEESKEAEGKAEAVAGDRSPEASGDRLVTDLRPKARKVAKTGGILKVAGFPVYSPSIPEALSGTPEEDPRARKPKKTEG